MFSFRINEKKVRIYQMYNCSIIKLIWHNYNIFGYLLFTIGGTPLLMDGRF